MPEDEAKRRGLSIYQREEKPRPAMAVDDEYKKRTIAAGVPEEWFDYAGAKSTMLFMDSDGHSPPVPGTVILAAVRYGANYMLPRHAHTNGDCLYYVSEGEIRLGNKVLKAGEGFFVPSSAPYQYEAGSEGAEVLEIKIYQPSPEGQPGTIWSETPERWEKILETSRANNDEWTQAGLGRG